LLLRGPDVISRDGMMCDHNPHHVADPTFFLMAENLEANTFQGKINEFSLLTFSKQKNLYLYFSTTDAKKTNMTGFCTAN
jgi:hypothetical protein